MRSQGGLGLCVPAQMAELPFYPSLHVVSQGERQFFYLFKGEFQQEDACVLGPKQEYSTWSK